MYAEEYLAHDVYNFSDVSIDESSTIDSDIREQRKITEGYKRLDKNFYSYKIKQYDGDELQSLRIQIYSSPLLSNSFIRNASTGIKMSDRVGSKYEDLYFVMMDVATETKTELNKESRRLYYSNPEECERHLKIKISQEIKERWMQKHLKARARFC